MNGGPGAPAFMFIKNELQKNSLILYKVGLVIKSLLILI